MQKQSAETNEQAWVAWNAEAIKLINQAGDFFHEEIDPRLWQDALRFALDEQGASERCPRRGCRAARSCQLRFKAGTPLDCGAGLSDETLKLAIQLTLFSHLAWFERWWADLTGPTRQEKGQASSRR
ncbi:hypothetical protein [Tianweitania sp.]|uniref:hypothetical protein n=1 Tax=Tianweitania sp. TaxID=2021634 RepID=UPI0028A160F0|nr:hypothetical protein [Tianweitania sp.]